MNSGESHCATCLQPRNTKRPAILVKQKHFKSAGYKRAHNYECAMMMVQWHVILRHAREHPRKLLSSEEADR